MAYKSKGTVRLEGISGSRTSTSTSTSWSWKLLFVPDNDHSVKDGDKCYAVFLNTKDEPLDLGRVAKLDEKNKGVSITLPTTRTTLALLSLSSAAATQIKVEIEVEFDSSTSALELRIIGIDLPAP